MEFRDPHVLDAYVEACGGRLQIRWKPETSYSARCAAAVRWPPFPLLLRCDDRWPACSCCGWWKQRECSKLLCSWWLRKQLTRSQRSNTRSFTWPGSDMIATLDDTKPPSTVWLMWNCGTTWMMIWKRWDARSSGASHSPGPFQNIHRGVIYAVICFYQVLGSPFKAWTIKFYWG